MCSKKVKWPYQTISIDISTKLGVHEEILIGASYTAEEREANEALFIPELSLYRLWRLPVPR